MDIRAALKEAMSQLRTASVPSHTLAAELLLMHALERDRTWLYTHPEAQMEPQVCEKYFGLIARRASGEPTQYITGKQEFWGLEFRVTPAVLIPRPETEHVMEVALERLGTRGIKIDMKTGAPSPALDIADVGTGSGCLAIALAWELPQAIVVATDTSPEALKVARKNAERHSVANRIKFVETDLLSSICDSSLASAGSSRFDLIVSNPPYVAEREAAQLPREVREHEPHAALFAGPSGVEVYPRLIEQAEGLLRTRGILVLELGHNSLDEVQSMLKMDRTWGDIRVTNDLAGIARVVSAIRME